MHILHIGRHKTGTSSLQHFLAANLASLASAGYVYPRAMRPQVAHHELAYLCNERLYGRLPSGEQQRLLEELDRLQEEVAGDTGFLLSSEAFQNVRPSQVARYLGTDLMIVVYIREQFQYLLSSYAQVVQNQKLTHSIEEYEQRTFRADYARFLDSWAGVFGQDRVQVRVFERAGLAQGDIRHDFIQTIGLGHLLPAMDFDQRRHNTSIGGALLDFKRRLNATAFEPLIPPPRLYSLLERTARRCPELVAPTERFDALALAVRERYRESNEVARARFFPQRPVLFALPDSPLPAARPAMADVAEAIDQTHGSDLGHRLLALLEAS
ncbi:MAG TPA: hypothetical protein VLA16_15095 [Ideonella sp.]|nr:hypothetical protein [Ideonella sp.]